MFIAYGSGITNPVPLEKLFVQPAVTKTSKSSKSQNITQENSPYDSSSSAHQSERAKKAYQSLDSNNPRQPTLKAAQLMTTPVVSLYANEAASEVLDILDRDLFRHIPVLSNYNYLVGMVSDRDIYRCLCGTRSDCVHCSKDRKKVLIETIMKDQVLAATVDADARYIARLFVEQRVGALPIVDDDQLVGIVTRSDILRAVMLHLHLDIWE